MTNRRLVWGTVALFIATSGAHAQSLRELKAKYLNNRVLIQIGNIPHFRDELPSGYDIADKKGLKKGVYESSYNRLPVSYLGKPATVVEIRVKRFDELLDELRGDTKPRQPNALGEQVSDDDREIEMKLIEAVLRFDDGTVALYSEMYSKTALLTGRAEFTGIQLSSVRDKHAKAFATDFDSIIGKDLYIPGYAAVFPLDATVDDMESYSGRITFELPLLTPAKIVAARYLDLHDKVVLKLRLVNGREVLSAAQFREENAELLTDGLSVTDDSTLGRIAGHLLLRIPPTLTEEEVRAIQNLTLFKGMSELALYYLHGKVTANRSGDGTTQLVYSERFYVYLDKNHKVSSWQLLGR